MTILIYNRAEWNAELKACANIDDDAPLSPETWFLAEALRQANFGPHDAHMILARAATEILPTTATQHYREQG